MTGRATTQEAILHALGPKGCMTTAEIAAAINKPMRHASEFVGRLVVRDLVERIERGCYRLTAVGERWLDGGTPLRSGPSGPATGVPKPRKDTFRQRAWTAMRLRPTFTSADILERAARSDQKDAPGHLGRYLRALKAAGVVIETPRRARGAGDALTSNGCKVWRLARDLGEIAPRLSAKRGLIDLNAGGR